jgi:TctA family transporter
MLLGFILGVLISLLTLIPGLHAASLLMVVLPLMGTEVAISAACVSIGCSSMLGILGTVKSPVTKETLMQSDVAVKLAHKGYLDAVVRIHTMSVWVAFCVVSVIAGVTVFSVVVGENLLWELSQLVKGVVPWILGFVLVGVVLRSSRPVRTALITLGGVYLGFWVFNGAGLRSNPWVMTPLLSGLFMVGSTLSLLFSRGEALVLPSDRVNHWEINPETEVKGALIGCITGFLAGIGTSSLVALVGGCGDEEDYLALQSAADAANNFFAVLAFVLIGSTRSGSAAAIATIANSVSAFDALIYLSLISAGLIIGEKLLRGLSSVGEILPKRLLALVTLIGTVCLCYKTTGSVGLLVLVGAWLLGSQARAWHVPNQALLAVMIGPVMLYYLGATKILLG